MIQQERKPGNNTDRLRDKTTDTNNLVPDFLFTGYGKGGYENTVALAGLFYRIIDNEGRFSGTSRGNDELIHVRASRIY